MITHVCHRRFQALEQYRQLLRQSPAQIDLFQAALLIAKHRHPLLVSMRIKLFRATLSCLAGLCIMLHNTFSVAIKQQFHAMHAQDESQCNKELSQLVQAVQGSLPSTSEQPGFELVYITRYLITNFCSPQGKHASCRPQQLTSPSCMVTAPSVTLH